MIIDLISLMLGEYGIELFEKQIKPTFLSLTEHLHVFFPRESSVYIRERVSSILLVNVGPT